MLSTFTAFFDSNVFFRTRLTSLILFMAQSGHFRARWSDDVHREWIAAALAKRPDLTEHDLIRRRNMMDSAVQDCKATGYEALIPNLTLPDPDDRHILAAAIRSSASVIVTFNEKHFPESALSPFGLHTRRPDQFLLDLESLDGAAFIEQVRTDRTHYRDRMPFQNYVEGLRAANVSLTTDFLKRVAISFEALPEDP